MVEDTPDDLVFELHNEALWGTHPYGYSILGTRDTVSALSVRRPPRAARARVPSASTSSSRPPGNVEHDALLEALERTGWARRAARRQRRRSRRERRARDAAAAAPRGARQRRRRTSCSARPTVAHGDPRRYAISLVSMLLGGGMSSRLFQRVREELGLAYSVYTFQSFHADIGSARRVRRHGARDSAGAAADAIRAELARWSRAGFPTTSWQPGKSQLRDRSRCRWRAPSSRMYRAAAVGALRRAVPAARRAAGARSTRSTTRQVRAVCARRSSRPTRRRCSASDRRASAT